MVVQISRTNQIVTQTQKEFTNHKKNYTFINTNYTRSSIQIDEAMRPSGHCMMQILIFANFLGLNKKGSKHSAKMAMNAI